MHLVRRIMTLLIAVSAGVLFSQAPELSQQYRQRLGGAIDELTSRIQDFDEQANHNGLDRLEAMNVYARSPERFIRSQGETVRRIFERYEKLSNQMEELTVSSPILRPLVVARRLDPVTFSNAWRDFVPAVPLSVAGAVWSIIGLIAGLMVAILFNACLKSLVILTRHAAGRRKSPGGDAASMQRA